MKWKRFSTYQQFRVGDVVITLEPRPIYCDRGDWIAKIFSSNVLNVHIDEQDGWPRYYFNEKRAKAEIKSWLIKRNLI